MELEEHFQPDWPTPVQPDDLDAGEDAGAGVESPAWVDPYEY